VLAVNDAATGGLQPDRTLLLRIPREEAAARRDGDADRIESEAGAFHDAVAEGFSQAAIRFPERVRVVDAGGSREQVAARVREAVGV
jgi:dTMP kinase